MGYPSRKKEEQDYARNAIASGKDGNKKASAFDKKKLTELSAGEGMSMHGKTHGGAKMYDKGPNMESNAQVDKNLFKDMPIDSRASKGSPAMNLNKGYGKPMASPMKMAGSWMSKHSKSKM